MKSYRSTLVVLVTFLAGCNSGTTGGPGAVTENDRRSSIQPENSFSLDVPKLTTSVTQGEAKTVKIGVDRTKNFDEDVKLSFSNVPTGVTVEPQAPVIKHGQEEAVVTIAARADAAVGDFTVKVVGEPTAGPKATSDLPLKIAKR
jgi:hypothetical protein